MKRSKSHRVALIGCGRVAQHYIQIFTTLDTVDGMEIVGCCDLDLDKASAATASLGGEAHSDAVKMLAKLKPDVALVLTESGNHSDHARIALEAGCHTIVEKPIGLRPDDVLALDELARENGLMYGGVFQNRYNPAVVALKQAISSGRFGRIVTATVRLRWCRTQDYYEDGWHGTWAQDGGVINQQAIHHVDALNWICGPIESVCASMGNRANELEAEDTIVAAVRFESGALGTIEATTAARPRDIEASLSVVGDKGLVELGGIALNEIVHWEFLESHAGDDTVRETARQDVPTGYGLGHGPFLKDLVARLDIGEIEPPIGAQEALRAVRLVHALYASTETNGWIQVGDNVLSSKLGVR